MMERVECVVIVFSREIGQVGCIMFSQLNAEDPKLTRPYKPFPSQLALGEELIHHEKVGMMNCYD